MIFHLRIPASGERFFIMEDDFRHGGGGRGGSGRRDVTWPFSPPPVFWEGPPLGGPSGPPKPPLLNRGASPPGLPDLHAEGTEPYRTRPMAIEHVPWTIEHVLWSNGP